MNEHAQSIWKAVLDGKTVQWYNAQGNNWINMNPMHCDKHYGALCYPIRMPHVTPDMWRIKPSAMKFRVAMFDYGFDMPVLRCIQDHEYEDFFKSRRSQSLFVRWVGPEQEIKLKNNQ